MTRTAAEDRLALLLVGTTAGRQRRQREIRDLLERGDQGLLALRLAEHRLLSIVGPRLDAIASDLVASPLRGAIARADRLGRARAVTVESATRRAIAALGAAGVRVLPLKGVALSRRLHGDPGARHAVDVDLLVPPSALDRAVAAVRPLGYRAPRDRVQRSGLPRLHHRLEPAHGALPAVELHWRVHWYEHTFATRALARARPGADGLLQPEPLDDLVMLLLFYARDGFVGLRLPADIAAWWDVYGHVEAGGLPALVAEHPGLRPAVSAALAVCAQLAVPDPPLSRAAAVPGGASARLAARLAAPAGDGSAAQLAANHALVGLLLAPPRQAPGVAAQTLRGSPGRPTLPHVAKLGARWAHALWRLRGGRSWCPSP